MCNNKPVKTTCPYCGVGCGLECSIAKDGEVVVNGDTEHPANIGKICVKGAALQETVTIEGRLLQPTIAGKDVSWPSAIDAVAISFLDVIKRYGPDAVGFYVSGQLLTEDYYVANKLMKGFVGSNNIDSNSRLCMASTVAGQKQAFGADGVPGCYEDIELADLVIFTGSNAAWCHPVIYQRVVEAKKLKPNLKIVVIDPRKTATCDIADFHLPLKPGSDATLWNGLLNELRSLGYNRENSRFIEEDADAIEWAVSSAPSIKTVAGLCNLKTDDVARFYELFLENQKVVTLFSQGINQSTSGTGKVNAILNCHLYSGRIGKPGMGPFSLTGQPNAMGGREVGALANQLAAHMDITNSEHRKLVKEFWRCKPLVKKPGYTAVDMFKAMADGKIKAVWIMGTNPAVSLPDSSFVKKALKKCPMVVVSDVVKNTDTSRYADIMLPALGWGEKSGTVTNSERCISRQRSFLEKPGQAKADWWIISKVAQKMGHKDAFAYKNEHEIFCEHAQLSGFKNGGQRVFDISGLAQLNTEEYDLLKPIQWPVLTPGVGTKRLYQEGYPRKNGKARLVTVIPQDPKGKINRAYPLLLNSGRVRDQWHTMTRSGNSPRLGRHKPEPYFDIHPDDAKRYGINNGELVKLKSALGHGVFRAVINNNQRVGELFAPMHWSRQFSSNSTVNSLVHPFLDHQSKQPEFKQTPVAIKALTPGWVGVAFCRGDIADKSLLYANRVKVGSNLWRYDLAGKDDFSSWQSVARSLFSNVADSAWLEYIDTGYLAYRGGFMSGDGLGGSLFMAKSRPVCHNGEMAKLFEKAEISNQERGVVLSGGSSQAKMDEGKIVCACFGVGEQKIITAILNGAATNVKEVGRLLKAGTNCGSCIPEIGSLLLENQPSQAVPA
ncbi:MAG: molybdopterin-dependent oxidoreductase [Magnetococcales bacterium]|nr:molybdopterin-dependent oxidoreductase [Magnetococcales bacterium]